MNLDKLTGFFQASAMLVGLFVLVFFPLHFGVKTLVHKVCDMESTRQGTMTKYHKRASEILSIKLPYENSVRDKATLTRSGVNLRGIIYEFPRNNEYTLENKNNIGRELVRQSRQIEKMGEMSNATVAKICWIVDFQVLIFLLAVFHTVVTGQLLAGCKIIIKVRRKLEKWPDFFVNMASHVSSNSSSILMTIGIGGTFWGLLVGLINANPMNVHSFNISAIFLGLKISFTSTLAGILLSLISRIVQQAFYGRSETIESVVSQVGELKEDLGKAVEKSVAKAVKAQHRWTFGSVQQCAEELRKCKIQLDVAHKDLEASAKEVKAHKDAIVEANTHLNNIATTSDAYLVNIKNINQFISRLNSPSENIGTSFKNIHENMKKHLEMESKYIGAIERIQMKLIDTIDSPTSSFQELTKSLQEMDDVMMEVLDSMKTIKATQ